MMQVMKDIGGVELPESLVKFTGVEDKLAGRDELPDDVTVRNGAGVTPK
jgi:hypothetical protein